MANIRVRAFGSATYNLMEFHNYCVEHNLEYVLSYATKTDSFDVSVIVSREHPVGNNERVLSLSALNVNGVHFLKEAIEKIEEAL